MESRENKKAAEREVIEHQLAKVEASIAAVETAAELESAEAAASDAREDAPSKGSDQLVALLIARLLRIAHRD
ncbi:MAG: hypothetical protein ACR652_24305 [Methylocystis sp.]|uniref:hypothetical protein n=1 Tax=Methylocystis sp. TaxID=1911079 RepID=UPI003DA3A646